MGSLRCKRRLPSRDPPKHRTDRHSQPAQISLPQDVPGHDLSCGEYVRAGTAVHLHGSLIVHFYAQISEGDARPQGVSEKWRRIDG